MGTNIQRFRHADPKRVRRFAVDSAQVVQIGDLVYQAADDVRAASGFTYVTGDLAKTQANFRRDFKGVAMEASLSGETDPISVATLGTFEFDCAAAQFEIGDRLGVDDNAGGTALLDGQVIAMSENQYGEIATVAKRYSANTTRVVAEINPFGQLCSQPLFIPVFAGLHTANADLVTNFVAEFPFKLVAVNVTVLVATSGVGTLTVRNGATALDDTVVVGDSLAVGAQVRGVMDDATGDDIFDAGDQLDVASDGTPTAGEIMVTLEVIPFLHHN